jgi:hypothetical protein
MGRPVGLLLMALAYAWVFCLGTGVIPAWGRWYSPSLHYRRQTDAFFRGELSLGMDPAGIDHDLVWSGGGIHQVWGLGVPAWRWLFEVLAAGFGQPCFPDRISFLVALVIWAWLVLQVMGRWMARVFPGTGWKPICGYVALALVTLFNPCLVSLCATRFEVYEEACAYAYLYGTALMVLLVDLELSPGARKLAWIALLAGLAPLIRPTLVFQGFLIVAMGWWICRVRGVLGGGLRWGGLWVVSPFSCGILMLLATNQIRFGSPTEFGHSLNFQVLFGSMYATRFDHPFQKESVLAGLMELLGAMFGVRWLNGDDYYAGDIFVGQSPGLRWREFYFSTFNIQWPALWAAGLVVYWWFRKRWAAESPGGWGIGWVALGATSALSVFYLRNSVISSRYIADFAPAFTGFSWVTILWVVRGLDQGGRWVRGIGMTAILGWWVIQLNGLEQEYDSPRAMPAELLPGPRPGATAMLAELPGEYRLGDGEGRSRWETRLGGGLAGIRYNGIGWDRVTGATRPLVAMLVERVEYLELEVAAVGNARGAIADEIWVRPKLHLSRLRAVSVEDMDEGCRRLRFAVPEELRGRSGPMALFIALGPPEGLNDPASPFRLRAVRWR